MPPICAINCSRSKLRSLIVGDLHLAKETPKAVSFAFAKLLDSHPGTRVVVAGDLFDFSSDHPRSSVEETLGTHLPAKRALGQFLDRGGELWLCSGNHDAEVSAPDF